MKQKQIWIEVINAPHKEQLYLKKKKQFQTYPRKVMAANKNSLVNSAADCYVTSQLDVTQTPLSLLYIREKDEVKFAIFNSIFGI